MEISPRTKVSDIVGKYPFLREFLVALNPEFKLLENPIMRNTIGRIATLNKAAMIGGMEVNRLLDALAGEILAKTGEIVSVSRLAGKSGEEDRISVLKEIIRGLHKGKNVEDQKKRFEELIKDVAPWEIAQMEQQLISEGMPESEIKSLCEVHVQVFREALEQKTVPGLPAGHPVHTFMLENRAAEELVREAESVPDPAKDNAKMRGIIEKIAEIDTHFLRKENQLFPILEAKGISGPSKVMWALHDDIRSFIKDTRQKVADGTVKKLNIDAMAKMIRDMIYKEEHILFPMALETLDEGEWARVRKGEEEIGYAWIRPETQWKPAEPSFPQALMAEKAGSLNLDTGQLTADQVNLILTHLPVDISFVNENDEVSYYSATADRIFPRSPAVIGRKVQNCHPPKSVGMVEKILSSFRDGSKDEAEFWIQMAGRFIQIRYFAVRDSAGRYRGCLEVSQDVTHIRELAGQKRLLDWD